MTFPGALACASCAQPFVEPGFDSRKTGRFVRAQIPEIEQEPPPLPSAGPGKARHATQSEGKREILAWLFCEPLPPLAIGPKPVLSLGRSRECDMILPHENVSRMHAYVRVMEGNIFLDDRSRHGTLLNGRPLKWARLEAGDILELGPYQVKIQAKPTRRTFGEAETTQ